MFSVAKEIIGNDLKKAAIALSKQLSFLFLYYDEIKIKSKQEENGKVS